MTQSDTQSQNKKDVSFYFERGNFNLFADRDREAKEDFSRAIELDPENREAYLLSGGCSAQFGAV